MWIDEMSAIRSKRMARPRHIKGVAGRRGLGQGRGDYITMGKLLLAISFILIAISKVIGDFDSVKNTERLKKFLLLYCLVLLVLFILFFVIVKKVSYPANIVLFVSWIGIVVWGLIVADKKYREIKNER